MKILPYPKQARVRNTAMMQTNAKLQTFCKKSNWKLICYFDTSNQSLTVKSAKVTTEMGKIQHVYNNDALKT